MSKKINLVYWNEDNFGDALSPVLVEELSGLKTQLKHAYKNRLRIFLKAVILLSFRELSTLLLPWQTNILGVGSIITCGNKKSKVWGSGFMSDRGRMRGGEVFAVRGPLTAQRITEQGLEKCDTYGDPALLLPLWLKPSAIKKYKLGIVPHWKETVMFIEKYRNSYKVIDLRTKDVKRIVEEITSCDYILSTSLHGLVVAHAYNIPALWIKEGYIETDGFKFTDYFSSVDIPLYSGFLNTDLLLAKEQNWLNLFKFNREKSLIQVSINEIHRGLLKATPFPLREKYRKILNGI